MYEWNYFDENEEAHPMTDVNNLYDGFRAARKGSHWKAQVQRFRWNALKEIGKLQYYEATTPAKSPDCR